MPSDTEYADVLSSRVNCMVVLSMRPVLQVSMSLLAISPFLRSRPRICGPMHNRPSVFWIAFVLKPYHLAHTTASANPGFTLTEDPKAGCVKKGGDLSDQAHVAPDQLDVKYETSRWEIWAYYSYHIGNNGLTLFNIASTTSQNLLSEAAGDAGTLRFGYRQDDQYDGTSVL